MASESAAMRAELHAIYKEVDALHAGWSCETSTDCCRFGVTGREPYPTALELAELETAVRARGGLPKRRSLPMAEERRCDLLGDDGRCLVYASRPYGCRTFFCDRASGPRVPRAEIQRLSRQIADLSARFDPSNPGPRPLSNVGLRTLGRPDRFPR
jgi:Fe-S-cluster containining protein